MLGPEPKQPNVHLPLNDAPQPTQLTGHPKKKNSSEKIYISYSIFINTIIAPCVFVILKSYTIFYPYSNSV
jgi:hypothetical protein